MADESSEAAAKPPLARRALQFEPLSLSHLIQIGVGIGVVIALLRLSGVADGEPRLAAAILQATGYVQPLLQMAIALVPTFIILFAVYVIHYARIAKRAGHDDVLSRYAWLFVVCAALLLAFATPWILFVLGVVVVTAIEFPLYLRDHARRRRGEDLSDEQFRIASRRQLVIAVTIVVGLNAFGAILTAQPWLPEEKLTTTSGEVRGYVLAVEQPWTTVLVDNPRYLKYVRTTGIVKREVCSQAWNETLWDVLHLRADPQPPPTCDPPVTP